MVWHRDRSRHGSRHGSLVGHQHRDKSRSYNICLSSGTIGQCGLNAGGMTDFVSRGLQPRVWSCSGGWSWLRLGLLLGWACSGGWSWLRLGLLRVWACSGGWSWLRLGLLRGWAYTRVGSGGGDTPGQEPARELGGAPTPG